MNPDALKHLQQPPFNASVQYFLEKGTINGSFYEALKKFLKDNTGAAEQSEEVERLKKENEQAQERIKELQQQFDLVYKEWLALKIKYERDDFQKAHERIQAALNPKG